MIQKELLNGGVVQVRNPLLLRPGELQDATDCILRPGDPSIQKSPGNTSYGVVQSQNLTCTTDGTTALTSSSQFGTDIGSVTVTDESDIVTSSAAFGSVNVGDTIVGTNIPAGTYVAEVIDSSTLRMTQAATGAGTAITHCSIHPGTFISGTYIPSGTRIASITDASNLTMDTAATGSSAASRAFTERVKGLRALVFDNNTDILAATAADQLYLSPVTDLTGNFVSLTSARGLSHNSASFLDSVQAKNRHIFFTGFDTPRVVYYADNGAGAVALTQRPIGMLPVTSLASVTATATDDGYSWRTDEGWGAGYYYILVTEVAIFGENDEVESTWTGDTHYAKITDATAQGIIVTYLSENGQAVNHGQTGRNTATHWRIYMAPRNSLDAGPTPAPSLSSYRLIETVPISVNSIILSDDSVFRGGWASDITQPDPNVSTPTLLTYASSNALAQTTTDSVASCVLTEDKTKITNTGGAFADVEMGMVVTSDDDTIPYGAVVTDKSSDDNTIWISEPASADATETLYFGNSNTFDGNYATAPKNPSAGARSAFFHSFGLQDTIGSFATMTVTGIEVEIHGGLIGNLPSDGDLLMWASLYKDGTGGAQSDELSVDFSPKPAGVVGFTSTDGVVRLGGPRETWGISWSPSDFADGASKVGVGLRKSWGGAGVDRLDHFIDGVKITVFGGSRNINLDGKPFRTVIISDQLGSLTAGPANGPPPIPSTGDLFEGMLLLNDTTQPNTVVASLPDEEEYFPAIYRLPLESKERDRITLIRRLGNMVILGCEGSIKRLNYFPRETDAEFNRGRAYEDIATDHGIVHPRAATLVNLPGRGLILAYLSHDGLRWTDGITAQFLNQDLDWSSLIEPTAIENSVLEVHPQLSLLCLYYTPAGESKNTACMYFSYHPMHIKEGFQLPAIGPNSIEAESAASLLFNGTWYLFTGHGRLGRVYVEDQGTTRADATNILPSVRTRRFFSHELGYSARVKRVFYVADADGDSDTGGFSSVFKRQDQGESVTSADTVSLDTETGGIIEAHQDNEAETFDLTISKSALQTSDLRLHFLGYETDPMGQDRND